MIPLDPEVQREPPDGEVATIHQQLVAAEGMLTVLKNLRVWLQKQCDSGRLAPLSFTGMDTAIANAEKAGLGKN